VGIYHAWGKIENSSRVLVGNLNGMKQLGEIKAEGRIT
jgi:hypothetical protein